MSEHVYTLMLTDERNTLIEWVEVDAVDYNDALKRRPDGWRRAFTTARKGTVAYLNG